VLVGAIASSIGYCKGTLRKLVELRLNYLEAAMSAVEFQAKIENGAIAVPDAYKQELLDGEIVTVVVSKQPKKKISQTGMIAELTRNPVQVQGIRSVTRDEMHERL